MELKEFIKENKNLAQFELLQCIYYELHTLNTMLKEYITTIGEQKLEVLKETSPIKSNQKPKRKRKKRNVKEK